MKLSERGRLIVTVISVLEGAFYISGTVWLVGWKGWNPWWMAATIILAAGSSPSTQIKAIEKV